MQLTSFALATLISIPGISSAQMGCTPVDQHVSLGEIAAGHADVEIFYSTVSFKCFNYTEEKMRRAALLYIDRGYGGEIYSSNNASIPFGVNWSAMGVSRGATYCKLISLGPGEKRIFDIPIVFEMSTSGITQGVYSVRVPIHVRVLDDMNLGNGLCEN